MLLPWAAVLLCANAQELALGIYGAMTTFTQLHIAVVVTFDLDLRKNFDASVRARYGPPIIQIPNLHPGVANITFRIGTSEGLYLAIREQADLANEDGRIRSAGLRNMQVNFVVEEGQAAIDIAKSFGSPFIFLCFTTALGNHLWPLMENAGMFGPSWQLVACESLTELPFPVGAMRWSPSSTGPKYVDWLDLWGNLTADDVLSTAARERYKIDNFRVPLSQATAPPITDATFENREVFVYDSFLFDASYTFVLAINDLLNSGTPLADIKGETLLNQIKTTQFEGISGASGSQDDDECRCAQGSFMCNESLATASCQPCPEGLTCPAGLDPPVQQPGFWAEPTACNFKVLRCRNQLECPGLALGECAKGRDGIACNNCHFNHYPLENGTCELCGPGDYWPSILAGLIGVLVAILLVRSAKVDLNQQSLNLLTVAAVASQTITALQALGSIRKLAVEWIYPVRRIIELTKIVSFDLDVIKIRAFWVKTAPP
eukprot:g8512.t1